MELVTPVGLVAFGRSNKGTFFFGRARILGPRGLDSRIGKEESRQQWPQEQR